MTFQVQFSGAVRRIATVLILVLALPAAVPSAAPAPESFADLAERLLPAVVNISTTQTVQAQRGPELPELPPGSPLEDWFKDYFDRRQQPNSPPRRATSLGSGFIVDATGYVVTNNHVIEGADEIKVTLFDDTTLDAEIVGRDSKTDLALIKIKAKRDFPFVSFGDSDKTRVGDWVVAIGNPFGLGGTVTAGIVSARSRDIHAGPYDDFIQTDASINRGNSGGPMFNLAGEVIGVNTAIYSPSGGSVGIGFAIPSKQAASVIAQLKEFGRTRRGWLGVHIQTVTEDLYQSFGLKSAQGALVASVSPGSPAAEAGIRQGDVILRFAGETIGRMRQLPAIVADTPVGKVVDVEISRGGENQTLQVTVAELDEAAIAAADTAPEGATPADEAAMSELGLTLSAMTDEVRERFQIGPDLAGVVVVEVDPASEAAAKGLTAGDVIEQVDHQKVETPEAVAKQLAAAKSAGRQTLVLLIRQGGRNSPAAYIALRIGG